MTPPTTTAPHPFHPDAVGEPGYRPRCTTCGQERHPASIPTQRTGSRP